MCLLANEVKKNRHLPRPRLFPLFQSLASGRRFQDRVYRPRVYSYGVFVVHDPAVYLWQATENVDYES